MPFVPVSIRDFNGVEIIAHLRRPVRHVQRPGLLDLGSESSQPDRLRAEHDDHLHERSRPDAGPGKRRAEQPIRLYNPKYSNFCYTIAVHAGHDRRTWTLRCLPVAAFASGYNPVDCAYPDTTPAIKEVDGGWSRTVCLTPAGHQLTITSWAMCRRCRTKPTSGRDFGRQSTPATGLQARRPSRATMASALLPRRGTVTIGSGIPMTNVVWDDAKIQATSRPAFRIAPAAERSTHRDAANWSIIAGNGKKRWTQ